MEGNERLQDGPNKESETESSGITQRGIMELFDQIVAAREVEKTKHISVFCSFLQIYNEKLYDLFQDKDSNRALNIREDKYTGIFVEG